MGNKESRPSIIPYEDAVRKVSDEEFKRLREAFKRYSTPAGYMSRPIFIKDVLGDSMPTKLGEHLFYAFGGTNRGMVFRDLLSGLVLLTKGTQTEKLKFIFALCASHDNGMYISRDDLENFISACDGSPPSQEVGQLFREVDKVSYEQFCSWLIKHSHVMKLSAWLLQDVNKAGLRLSDESETPTFYQTLAGVTHLEEADIIELEKKYWVLQAQSKSGRFDLDTFIPLISPPMPIDLCEGVFHAFDENCDNHIDLKEMACGLSACCRGPQVERQKFCFKIFDADHDGLLNRNELESMVKALINVRRENRIGSEIDFKAVENLNPASIAMDILSHHDGDNDGAITAEEFQVWAVKNSLPDDFYKLLFQICHIILGLRPSTKEEERDIIMGWVDREKRRGLRLTQTWYLVSMPWWRQWTNYVNNKFNTGVQKASSFSSPSHSSSTSPYKSGSQAWNDTKPRSPLSLRRNHSNPSDYPRSSANNNLGSPRASPKRLQSGAIGPSCPSKPGPIDNTPLILQDTRKVNTLTNEGGRLKRHPVLIRGRDYDILPDPVWKALAQWYAGGPALPRNVIVPSHGDPTPQLELYPISVKLLRHQTNQQRQNTWNGVNIGSVSINSGGISFANNTTNNAAAAPKRYLAYTSSFSKMHTLQQVYEFLSARLRIRTEEMRLWNLRDENNPILLEDDSVTMEQANIIEDQSILIEVRNKDLSWPEEMSLLAKTKQDKQKSVRTECGVTGLSNLGNTCFMNAAVQCLSNTQPLTLYFKIDSYLFELNSTNPLGMKGHIAKRYGDLIKDLWAGNAKSIAPLKLRWTIAKYASQFNGFQQQDSQELLAFLLDGLHEDLNRVQEKPYTELKDSDGRPDDIVAAEAWDNHLLRNQSIIVDLFHGQLKSQVRCKTCGHVSVKFDPFTFLSLPLPMESSMHLEIVVVRLDGTVPVKYGLRLNMDDKYKAFKKQLADLCGLSPEQLLLVEVGGAMVKSFPSDAQKIRTLLAGMLYAYEIPAPIIHTSLENITHLSKGAQTQLNHTQENSSTVQPLPPVETNSSTNDQNNSIKHHPNGGITSNHDNNESTPKHESPTSNINRPNGDIVSRAGSGRTMRPNGDVVQSSPTPKTHSRNPSNASSASSIGPIQPGSHSFDGFVVAMHRKMIRMDMYFLSCQKSRPCLFGIPLILPCTPTTAHEELYKAVWMQVARLVSSPAPGESTSIKKNHAEDGDSPRHSYPFMLKAVQKDGLMCAWCPWYRFCRGCEIICNKETFGSSTAFLAIDWDPTALHLRYQSSQERVVTEHDSVERSRRLQTEPISLDDCLRAFTKEEELGEEDFYYCSKCKQHRLAAKKLDIWRLPPILIVHMKRFQFVNGRWVKSQKIVKFPKHSFDPSNFLAPREACNISTNQSGIQVPVRDTQTQTSESDRLEPISTSAINVADNLETDIGAAASPNGTDVDGVNTFKSEQSVIHESSNVENRNQREHLDDTTTQVSRPTALPEPLTIKTDLEEDGSSVDATGDNSEGGHPPLQRSKSQLSPPVDATDAHPLLSGEEEDEQRPWYNLYAVVCHTGILGGGHYVSYGVNPNSKWYCYNDSSVKELKDEIDTDNAYMLFYERTSLNYASFVPDTQGKVADTASIDDEIEADYKKFCVIQ